ISFPWRTRVLVSGSRAWGAAGSGICFTHTTTFMGAIVPEDDHLGPIRPSSRGDGPFPPRPGGDVGQDERRRARASETWSEMTRSTPALRMARRSFSVF